MVMFASIAALLLLLAGLWWFSSVRISTVAARNEEQALAQEQLNTYQLRLKELAYEREYDELDDSEYESSVNDLKRQLLHDLKSRQARDKNKQFSLFLPGAVFLMVFVAAFYYVNGESQKLDDWGVAVARLPELGKRVMSPGTEPLTEKELQQFALGLRTQLFQTGDDALAWYLLGYATLSLKDYEGALAALQRSYEMEPDRESTWLLYARTLLMGGDMASLGKAATIVSRVLNRQPQNIDALLITGYIAEQMQDFQQAKLSWQSLLQLMAQDDPRRGFVEERLATFGPGAEVAGNEAKLNIKLQLGEDVKDKVPEGAILFVYAKAPQGRPMPAAVVKLEQFSLPMTVELSDANAMLPDYKLSTLTDVVIMARISKDGDISVSSGELQGQTQVFTLKDTQEVSLVINQVL